MTTLRVVRAESVEQLAAEIRKIRTLTAEEKPQDWCDVCEEAPCLAPKRDA